MNRRDCLSLSTKATLALLITGCAGKTIRPQSINVAAIGSGGAEGHGVWQHGRLLEGRALAHRLPSLSITKALAALAALRAHAEGWLVFDAPLTDAIPEWRGDAAKQRITTRMLLNQTAGFPTGAAELYRGTVRDKGRVAVALPLVDEPGRQFRYGPAATEVLAEVLRRKLAERQAGGLAEFLAGLMRRIGVASPNWRTDGVGTPYLSTGAEFSVADLGRLGGVVGDLAAGRDRCGISAAAFLDLASPRSANPMFAAGIWWNRNAARPDARTVDPERHLDPPLPPAFWQTASLAADLDPGWLAMVGSGGKRVYALPGQALVVARIGRTRHFSDAGFLRAITAA